MSVNVIITGVIVQIFPVETYSSNFTKRVIWLQETDQQYPQTYAIEFHNTRTAETDPYDEGSAVTCKCDIRGKKWDKGGKSGVIVSLTCWHIEGQKSAKPAQQASTRQQTGRAATGTPQPGNTGFQQVGEDDDLPF